MASSSDDSGSGISPDSHAGGAGAADSDSESTTSDTSSSSSVDVEMDEQFTYCEFGNPSKMTSLVQREATHPNVNKCLRFVLVIYFFLIPNP